MLPGTLDCSGFRRVSCGLFAGLAAVVHRPARNAFRRPGGGTGW